MLFECCCHISIPGVYIWKSHEISPILCWFQAVPAGIQLGLSDDLARVQLINSGARWRAAGPAFVFFNKRISSSYTSSIPQIDVKYDQIWTNMSKRHCLVSLCMFVLVQKLWSKFSKILGSNLTTQQMHPQCSNLCPAGREAANLGRFFGSSLKWFDVFYHKSHDSYSYASCQLLAVLPWEHPKASLIIWLKMQQAAMQNLWWCLFMLGQFVVSPNISKLNANQSWR